MSRPKSRRLDLDNLFTALIANTDTRTFDYVCSLFGVHVCQMPSAFVSDPTARVCVCMCVFVHAFVCRILTPCRIIGFK